jgi:phosphate:Na+ symporter
LKKAFFIISLIILLVIIYLNDNLKDIAAGIAILLFGIMYLENGFKYFSGGPIERWLKKSTSNLFKSISFGVISTSLLQSSSLVSVITISFLSAGIIELSSGIGIVFGANIGTTTGAWLIALFGLKLKISSLAMPMLVVGVILVLQSYKGFKGLGYVLAGIGFLFLGIHFMKVGFESYQQTVDLTKYSMTGIGGLLVYTILGIAATVIMQSSHASLALVLTALSIGQVTYENALAMAIGANIGTTITALIGSISSNTEGKKLAGAHLVFNFITGIVALVFISQFKWLVESISGFIGISQSDYILKLSLFHTLFNLFGLILVVPFTPLLVKVLNKYIKQTVEDDISQPKFITKTALEYPDVAIPALFRESRHLFDNAFEIISHSINLHRTDILSDKKLKELIPRSTENMELDIDEMYYKKIKLLYRKIVKYATIIQSAKLDEDDAVLVNKLRIANRNIIEIIKELRIIQRNVYRYSISDNEYINTEYNFLRLKMAKVMREIYRTEKVDNLVLQGEKLKSLQLKAKQHDVLINGKLDDLIRNKKINSDMATSLMNDSGIVSRINERLITVAQLLFIEADTIIDTETEDSENQVVDFFEETSI